MVMTSTASLPKERVARPKRPRHLSEAMRCETAFRLIVSECLEDVATNHDATCAGETNALHQTRVALTRLRAAVAFYAKMVADIEWTRLKSELKWLSAHLGATRDLVRGLPLRPERHEEAADLRGRRLAAHDLPHDLACLGAAEVMPVEQSLDRRLDHRRARVSRTASTSRSRSAGSLYGPIETRRIVVSSQS